MIHRTHRFHGRTSLRFVYQRGQTVRCAHSSLKYAHNLRRRDYRVAVVVSRKVHKSAVVRNRIRRRIYEVVRGFAPQIREPYDMIFTVFTDQIATMNSDELHASIHAQLEKAGIIAEVGENLQSSSENHA